MSYEYSVYYRQNCIVPLILSAFCCVVICVICYSSIKGTDKNTVVGHIGTCLYFCIPVCLLVINLIVLSRGGIWLLYEKETDNIRINGTIEKIENIDAVTGAKYQTTDNNGNGKIIFINSQKYYLMTTGNLKAGSNVVAKVLPRSHFILSIEELGEGIIA